MRYNSLYAEQNMEGIFKTTKHLVCLTRLSYSPKCSEIFDDAGNTLTALHRNVRIITFVDRDIGLRVPSDMTSQERVISYLIRRSPNDCNHIDARISCHFHLSASHAAITVSFQW